LGTKKRHFRKVAEEDSKMSLQEKKKKGEGWGLPEAGNLRKKEEGAGKSGFPKREE